MYGWLTSPKVALDQYMEIISSSDAWLVADDSADDTIVAERDLRPTNSARRIKALVEQITGQRAFRGLDSSD